MKQPRNQYFVQLQTACTQSETFAELMGSGFVSGAPDWTVCTASSAAALQLTAASPARCPLADTPQVTARAGSMPYFEALSRSQRMASFTSWASTVSPLDIITTNSVLVVWVKIFKFVNDHLISL